VKAVDIGKLCGETALLWGQTTQERHGELVSESLRLAQHDSLERARRHVQRALEILGSIQLDKVFQGAKKGIGGFIAGFARKASDAIDTPDELEGSLAELRKIVGLLKRITTSLVKLREELEANADAVAKNGDEVEAALCAAAFLAGYVRSNQAEFRSDTARHLDARATSLAATLAAIRGDGAVRKVQADNPVSFIQLIQDVALVTLPEWLATIATALVGAATRPINPTDVSELADGLQRVTADLRR
jgi:hypothetical protein